MMGVKSFNMLLVLLIALWIVVLVYIISSLMVNFTDGPFTILTAIAGVMMLLVCVPVSLAIHRVNSDPGFKKITLGLAGFILLTILSGVVEFVLPSSFSISWLASLGQLLWFVAYALLIIPLYSRLQQYRSKLDGKIDVGLTAVWVITALIILYSLIVQRHMLEINGFNLLAFAGFVIVDIVLLSLLSKLLLIHMPNVYRYFFAILFIFFFLNFISDSINYYIFLKVDTPLDVAYTSPISMNIYALGEVFLTVALLLYSSRNINPLTVEEVKETLQDTQCLMNVLIAQSPDATCICDVDGNVITSNEAFGKIFKGGSAGPTGRPNLFDGTLTPGLQAAEFRNVTAGGTVILPTVRSELSGLYLSIKLYPTYTSSGKMSGCIIVAEDITERTLGEQVIKASLEEKKVLLKEIHHRVKNNLQIISSLLSIQASYVTDPSALECFIESQQRVKSMALIHEKLYQSEDLSRVNFTEYISNLSAFLFRSYNISHGNISLDVQIENITMDIDLAIPCGLIVNELVSNSLKYAFPGGKTGEIRITMGVSGDHYVLTVCDNGVGFPPDLDYRNSRSLGLQLVNTLVSQLEGTIDLDCNTGTNFVITFPALKKASGPAGRLQPQ